MVSTEYIKGLMHAFSVTQKDLAEKWTEIRLDGRKKHQSGLAKQLNDNDHVDSITLIKALSILSGVPVADIVDEVSWNQDKNTVIYNVNEPSPEYDKSTVPVISGNEEVGRVSLPHDWMRKGVNKIAKANTEGMDFNPRDFIGAVLLNQWEWPTMKDGKLYEIVTKHDGAFVKRVKNRINDSSKIICLSDNPAYSPIHLNVKDVDQIWEVSFRVSWDFPIPDRVSYLESEVDDMKIVIGKIYEEIKGMKGK